MKQQKKKNQEIKEEVTKIYLVTHINNDLNQVYIGKTMDPKGRSREHIKKWGKNITYTYIDEVNSLSSKDWKPLECYWIEQFKQWGFELHNKNEGGGGCSFMSEETKRKISISLKGRKVTWKTKGPKGYKYTEEQKLKRRGYKYTEKQKLNMGRPILQFTLDGNFIKEWPSQKSAQMFYFPNSKSILADALKGIIQKTSCGFIWKYKYPTRKL